MSKTAGDYLCERLLDWGVSTIYGFPGDGINGILGALRRYADRLRFIQTRHEEMAAFMACEHAKFTGEARLPARPVGRVWTPTTPSTGRINCEVIRHVHGGRHVVAGDRIPTRRIPSASPPSGPREARAWSGHSAVNR